MGQYVMSLNSVGSLSEEHVIRVKGKCLNSFLGIVKSDLPRLAIEAFPEKINRKLTSLQLLKKYELIWFDIQIENRVATLRTNIFIGENLGNNVFKIGILCLIGIAHLPEHLNWLTYKDQFSVNPGFQQGIGRDVDKLLLGPGLVPDRAYIIVGNLFHAIKLISSKALPQLPISGNVQFTDSWETLNKQNNLSNMEDEQTGWESQKDMNNLLTQSYLSTN